MSWRKHFQIYELPKGSASLNGNGYTSHRTNQTFLPDVYKGMANRVDRYRQYDEMDTDSEVSRALDIIAEFCTQHNDETGYVFNIRFNRLFFVTHILFLN